jgi:hypothetical protein
LIEKYDGSYKASSVDLNRIHAWVQIHDIPEIDRKKPIITNLATNVGEVISVELNPKGDFGGYARVRFWLDVRKELTRFVTINPECLPTLVMRVKYEKVPRFCAVCGFLGHVKEECGSGEHAQAAKAFGKWLLADTTWNHSQLYGDAQPRTQTCPPVGGRGTKRSGRGGFNIEDGSVGGRGHGEAWHRKGDGGCGRGGCGAPVLENRKRRLTDASLSEVSPIKEILSQPPLRLVDGYGSDYDY